MLFPFFQNIFGALLGIFLALFFVARVGDGGFFRAWREEPPPEEALSLQDILPRSAALLTEGMNEELLQEVREEEIQATTTTPEGETPSEPPPPKETSVSKTKEAEKTPPLLSAPELNTLARAATVNIFCTLEDNDAASGSGVLIDERGIILTNAHIAQYFLLDTYKGKEFVSCAIRTGSPAKETYKGELLYLPSRWIEAHAGDIDTQYKDGVSATGEHDYALVRIIPDLLAATTSLPALSPVYETPGLFRNEPVLVASYPAGFLGAEAVKKNLWLVSSFAEIKELYNFASSTPGIVDVFSVHGVVGAQEGSSGGAVVRADDGKLLGLVVTRSLGDTTGERDLFALGIPYINKDFLWDIKKTLQEFLASDIDGYQTWFNENARPQLKERLLQEIET